MLYISSRQVKCARACLDWTREQMAEAAGISAGTVYNLENGKIALKSLEAIQHAVEKAGWEFLPDDGIRRKSCGIQFMSNADGAEAFYESVLEVLTAASEKIENKADLCIIMPSPKAIANSLGITTFQHERIQRLLYVAKVRCIVADPNDSVGSLADIEFRVLSNDYYGATMCYTYGDKFTVLMQEKDGTYRIAAFDYSANLGTHYKHFEKLWTIAEPLIMPRMLPARKVAGIRY